MLFRSELARARIFSEDTPTERRVLAAFLYHAGLSYRRIELFVDRSYEAIRQWFHRLKHLFEPDCRDCDEVAVDETKISIDGDEHYVWAAVDCETFEVLAVEVTPGRSSFDAFSFLKGVLERCRGRPALAGDRGPLYSWPLELLDCEYERETWRNRSFIEAWSGYSNTEPGAFIIDFQSTAPPSQPDRGSQLSPLSTMRRSNLGTFFYRDH